MTEPPSQEVLAWKLANREVVDIASLRVAEAERDRLAARVAELEDENRLLAEGVDANYSLLCERDTQLQQATEALRELEAASTWLVKCFHDMQARVPVRGLPEAEAAFESAVRSALAALAGEDEAPPKPQREGDYL